MDYLDSPFTPLSYRETVPVPPQKGPTLEHPFLGIASVVLSSLILDVAAPAGVLPEAAILPEAAVAPGDVPIVAVFHLLSDPVKTLKLSLCP